MLKIRYIFIVTYLITNSGCSFSADSLIDSAVSAFKTHVLHKISPPPAEAPTAKPNDGPDVILTEDHRQVAAEFVKEMVLVVLEREVTDVNEFSKLVNNLEQGGHYEALYNGLIYSQEYRAKEKQVAPISALRRFAEMMADLTLDQRPDQKKDPTDSTGSPDSPDSKDTNGAKDALIEEFLKQGVTQSKYTLKRRLSEELLKTVDLKKEYTEKLATWYAQFAVRLLRYQIDFGLNPRNNSDEYYHYKWALTAGEDRLKWECLNRIHRVMNGSI